MIFTENSGLVKYVWIPLILNETYKKEQVPNIGNLREVVYTILDKK